MARAFAAFLLSLLALPNAAFGQSSDPAWLDEMAAQLLLDEQCDVSIVMNLREGTLGGQNVYEARVRCDDGRMFDASRIGEDAVFTFKSCEIQVC
jgi:hypothetical protein